MKKELLRNFMVGLEVAVAEPKYSKQVLVEACDSHETV